MLMIRKLILNILIILIFSFNFSYANEIDLAPNAKSAILIDMDTATIIYKKNSNQPLPPASMTKIMTLLLIMDALEQGKISLQDKVRISENAASMGGSQVFLEVGEDITVEELLKAIAIVSANDAAVAMAEHVAGSLEVFIQMMNEKAKELKLENTVFKNVTGLPEEGHFSSAKDMAIMARELLKYQDITKYTKIYQDYIRKDTSSPFWLVNTNKLVRFYEGADGLKTGYTAEAKYCLTATAKKGDFRVIAVIMGAPSSKIRNKEISQMLDYAFNQYTNHIIYKKGDIVTNVKVIRGSKNDVAVSPPLQASILIKKGEKISDYKFELNIVQNKFAPVKKGEVLGYLEVKNKDNNIIQKYPLIANENVEKANFWQLLKNSTKKLLFIK